MVFFESERAFNLISIKFTDWVIDFSVTSYIAGFANPTCYRNLMCWSYEIQSKQISILKPLIRDNYFCKYSLTVTASICIGKQTSLTLKIKANTGYQNSRDSTKACICVNNLESQIIQISYVQSLCRHFPENSCRRKKWKSKDDIIIRSAFGLILPARRLIELLLHLLGACANFAN